MSKAITRTRKSRGRPATGAESVHLRVLPDQMAAIDAWIGKQKEPDLTRPEAIRRLVEVGLSKTPVGKPQVLSTSKQGATRAAELAAKVIEKKIPSDTPAEEKAARKRKLIQGPSVFRDTRKDRPR